MLIGLGVNPDPFDAINKAKFIVRTIPSEWIQSGVFKSELDRFSKYLTTLGKTAKGIGRDGISDIVSLLKILGFLEEANTVQRLRLQQ